MVSMADYDAWKARQEQSAVGAANVVLSASEVKPDEAAGDMRLATDYAKVTGTTPPLPVVKEYRNVFQAEIERQKNTTILSNAPRLTEWLRNPDNAVIARDDLENLSWVEGFGRGVVATTRRAGQRLQQEGNQFMFEQTARRAVDRTKSFGDLVNEQRRSGGLVDMQGNPVETWDGSEYLFALGRWVDARYAELIGTDDAKAAQDYAAAVKQNVDNIRAIPKSHIAQEFEKKAMIDADKESLGAALRNFASATLTNPLGAISWGLETAGESSPQLLAALGTTILTRNPVAGATVGGVGSYTTERYTSPAEFFKEKGIDLAKPEDVKRAIGDYQLMQDAANRGVIRGLIIGGFDMVSMGIAGRSLAGNPLVEAAAQAATQALLGAGGEYAARVAAGQEIDWNEVLAEGLGEMATGPVDAGIAGRRFIRERGEAKAAEGRRSFFQALSGQSQASALRERMPDKFREFVEEATRDGPVSDVYVPADQFVTYFQGVGIDPFALVDTLEGVTRDDLDMAIAGGGDLKIPTATYAEKIAGSEHDAFLMENMRFDPNHMTAREAAEFNAKVDDIRQAAWEEAENARLDAEQYSQIEDQVYDRIVSELRVAGRSTEVATTEALPFQAFYRTMAERSGLTPEEFVARYMLPRVEGALPQGMQLRDIDALNRTLAEVRARKAVNDKRVSLLEFISDYGGINDVGGELKYRGAETVNRGRGKKSLKLARSGVVTGVRDLLGGSSGKRFGVDDVARAVVEAGYMAHDPDVLAYIEAERTGGETVDITRALWDAIDRELHGERQFSVQDEADPDIERAANLDQIEAYLYSIGVTLDDNDDVIRAAMQEAEARQYAQRTGVDLTPGGGAKEFALGDTVIDYGVSRDGQTAEIILVKTRKAERGQGSARRAMEALLSEFDRAGLTTFLTAEPMDKGVSKSGLVDFYKSLGFRENKGRNKDFRSQAAFIREPRPAGSHLFQRNETGARGSIQFPAGSITNGQSVIRLMETANLSTFTHEAGHFYLEVLKDMAASGLGNAADEFAVVKDWWRANAADVAKDANRAGDTKVTAEDVIAALDNGTTGDAAKDAAVNTGMHEQWARGLEAYFMEGKAPSADLRSAFEKVRAWLLSIYRAVSALDVKVSDELRGVFDRMLATDEQIDKAQESAGGNSPVFAMAEQMGLTQEEFDRLMRLRDQAESDARGRLLKEAMEPIRREREKWFKDERAKVREEVEREINASPMFRALEWMGNRRWLGEGQPEGMPDMRLSKDALVDIYGEGVLKTLRRGKQTVYTVEGGIHPDDAAGWFGFDSGDEMVKALEKAPNRVEAIDAETDKIMYERHGDVLNDGTVEEKALDAVHVDKRGQWIAAELKAIVDVAGSGTGLTIKEARATARNVVSQMRVRDAMGANRFLAAERKAAREAAQLGAMLAREGVWMGNARRRVASKARAALRDDGTVDAVAGQVEQANRSTGNYNETVERLIDAKRRQLLNHALYSEARSVAEEVGKAERFVESLGKASKRERIAGAGRRENAQIDYLAAIDELLERYDFRKMSGTAEQRRGSLLAFVEAMKAAGRENELAIPDDVLLNAGRTPYKTIPVEELRGVVDSLKNLEHVALRWDKLIDAQQQRELDTVVDGIVAAFDANVAKRPPGRVRTRGESLRNSARQFIDTVLNATTLLREIDGFKDAGAAYQGIKAPIDDAMNRLIIRKEKVATDLEALYAPYSKEERRRMAVREHVPELGYALSKWEKIAVALNMGNEGNRQRLMDRRVRGSLTEAQVAAVLASLDERDAKFVQSVWDYVGSFWPDIAERERRVTGTEPGKVEASPVAIAGKELRGGYYPLKYDPRLSTLARDDAAQEIAQSLQAGRFGKAQTKNGHTKERAQSSGRDVDLDMAVMHRHVNQVIYDLELGEAIANSWRVLQDGRIRSSFMDAGKQADFDALEIWLKDIAEGELKSADLVSRMARTFKSNFTAAKLAFNLSTAAVQVSGLAQSMVVVGKRDFARGVQASFRPGVVADITAKSAFMKSRATTFNKDIYEFYTDPNLGPLASRWGDIKRDYIGPLSFWLMTKTQFYLVDIPTWLAGYHQGLRRFGNDEMKAVAHADDVLKRTQASGLLSDRAGIERGSLSKNSRQNDVVRLFTTLASYMFAKFNVAYERSAKAARVVREEGVSAKSAQEVLSWTLDMAFLFTLEAILTATIKGKLPNSDDDEDDTWKKFLAKETAMSVMGTIPFVRDAASTFEGFEGGGAYGALTKEVAKPIKEILQGEFDKGLVKSVINGTGLAMGLPATQINRAVDAAWRQRDGEDVSPLEYLIGKTGKAK